MTMESLFIWIMFAAGAGLILMGGVLVASERELKAKRREIDLLVTKLEDVAASNPGQASTPAQADPAQLNELRSANQDLQSQVAGLTSKLEMSRRTIEEMENERNHADDSADAQQLRTTNERLAGEINELRGRLQAS